MRKVLTTALVFALVLAALLGVSAAVDRLRPEKAEEAPAPSPAESAAVNEMTPDKATRIELNGTGAVLTGMGAEVRNGTVTVAYPGTYRITGQLDGGVVVDLGDYPGAVYLILEGASIACGDGPAIHVRQADRTVLYLAEGSENLLRDGAAYEIIEGQNVNAGAAVYSADDLVIRGGGALTVIGSAADGIRSKDALTVESGELTVLSADDGLQASDSLAITGGGITVSAGGDGLATTEGWINVRDGRLSVTAAGDGMDGAGDILLSGGAVSVTAGGGPANYAAAAQEGRSARAVKGENITVTGGTIDLSAADDGIHAAADAAVTGGVLRIAAGDDGICAGNLTELLGGEITVLESYEALQGETVTLSGATVAAAAANNGVDAGEGGFYEENAVLDITAPRAVSTEGVLALRGGVLRLTADGTDSLFSFVGAEVSGCDLLALADTGTAEKLLEKGKLPGSVLFVLGDPLAPGTECVLRGPDGTEVLRFTPETETGAVLLSSGGMMEGQTYTLSLGEDTALEAAVDGTDCAVVVTEPAAPEGWGGPGGPSGGPPRVR